MKFSTTLPFFIGAAAAQTVIESSSFGHGKNLSPTRVSLPGWQLGGQGHAPHILSDKLILTPPYPGNTRGSAWSTSSVMQSEWTAEFQFRATGQERGGGNLQLWYAKDGQARVGTSSIYTVGPFDGFALVVDTHGGRGGTIRGFLNDGTTDYRTHGSVDSLAFGHCDYSYRNLGRPSVIRLKHTNSLFEVTVDDKPCFSTTKVSLPAGNTFGLTAATPENPDAFEVFKFVLQSIDSGSGSSQGSNQQQQQQPIVDRATDGGQGQANVVTDSSRSITEQFVDLGTRVQLINQASNNVLRELTNQNSKNENRHADLLQKLATRDQVASFDARLLRMEQVLQAIQRDLEGKDYKDKFNQLQETLKSSHLSLSESLHGTVLSVITTSSPRMGFFITLIIVFQLLLAGSYVIYKRRRANMPKKFL